MVAKDLELDWKQIAPMNEQTTIVKGSLRKLAEEYISSEFPLISLLYEESLLPEQCLPGTNTEQRMLKWVDRYRVAKGLYPLGEGAIGVSKPAIVAKPAPAKPPVRNWQPDTRTPSGREEIKQLVASCIKHGSLRPPSPQTEQPLDSPLS